MKKMKISELRQKDIQIKCGKEKKYQFYVLA